MESPLTLEVLKAIGQKDYAAAIAICDRVLAGAPHDSSALMYKAMALTSGGRHADAIAVYDQAIAAAPTPKMKSSLHGTKAHALVKLGRAEEAIACAQWIPYLEPNDPLAWRSLAGIYITLHRAQDAIATFDACIARMPNEPHAYGCKADYLLEAGYPGAAVPLYDYAIRLAPQSSHFYVNRACACMKAGDRQGALATAWHAIQVDPKARDTLKKVSELKPLHADPEFMRLVG